uniref:Uncharacterized protein n=1 Tax=Cyprinus carpio TaxID=7962 RepID=A0A8C1MHB3_CYPCA
MAMMGLRASYHRVLDRIEHVLPAKLRPIYNHPAGPKTVFFWAPMFKWVKFKHPSLPHSLLFRSYLVPVFLGYYTQELESLCCKLLCWRCRRITALQNMETFVQFPNKPSADANSLAVKCIKSCVKAI